MSDDFAIRMHENYVFFKHYRRQNQHEIRPGNELYHRWNRVSALDESRLQLLRHRQRSLQTFPVYDHRPAEIRRPQRRQLPQQDRALLCQEPQNEPKIVLFEIVLKLVFLLKSGKFAHSSHFHRIQENQQQLVVKVVKRISDLQQKNEVRFYDAEGVGADQLHGR